MTLMELKEAIKKEIVPNDLIVFVCPENTFLAEQYTEAICEIRNHTQNPINSLAELDSALSLVIGYSSYTNVLKTDVFAEPADYAVFENVIIICEKIDKKLKKDLADYIIEVPKLVEWQVKDYMKVVCPGLQEADIDWLYAVKEGNIYGINSELEKVALFSLPQQKAVLTSLRYEPGSYLYNINLFALSDAIVAGNKQVVFDFLLHDAYTTVDPIGLTGLLRNNIKNIILVTQNSNKTLEELKISKGLAERYKSLGYDLPRLQKALRFLAGIDYKLKNGLLDMPKDKQLEYIITNIMQ